MIRTNFWSGLGTALLAVVLLAWLIPTYGGGGFAIGMQPQRLATLGAWLILGCSITLALISAVALLRRSAPFIVMPNVGQLWHMLWPFLYVLGFIVLVDRFPLTWVAPLLIGGLLLILGERRWYLLLPVAVVPALGLYVLTAHLMRIGVV
ncbi:hypothetical protein [Halomonas salipaludis]|uniref:Tripartite tricarboxylate transporter TctB family protein n=1 Tax=Halomonas salipaludis TaxID=2032625 RepID=A0A2A2EXS9_9GAMM|nr:hypothetical protein [Halomonas salipaludis]PAU77179.1 hypothetical protein CK498_07960 [Halomonas salipaludis]